MQENELIRLLVVDDHQMLIDGIRSMLRKEKDMEIVAEARDGNAALDILNARTDISFLITDINMEGMSGTELTRKVKEKWPDMKVLVLSMYHDPAIVHEIVMAEAEGYILKNSGKQELIDAIRKIAANGTVYSNEVMAAMMKSVKTKATVESNLKNLSPREIEIIKLIVEEYSTNQIAEKLFISPRTVDTHRKNIIHKTGVKTIVGLIRFAFDNGLAG